MALLGKPSQTFERFRSDFTVESQVSEMENMEKMGNLVKVFMFSSVVWRTKLIGGTEIIL